MREMPVEWAFLALRSETGIGRRRRQGRSLRERVKMEIVKKTETDYERGRDASRGGPEWQEFYTLPSVAWLDGYFSDHLGDDQLGEIMARVIKHCPPLDSEKVFVAIRDLPPEARNALSLAFAFGK
jgi:hypothetical protein